MSRKLCVVLPIFLGMVLYFGVVQAVTVETAVAQPQHLAASESTFVRQIGGFAQTVTKNGNYLYVGMGNTLKVIDVQDPTNPQLVSQVDNLSTPVYEMHLFGDYGIATGENQLRIFDLQNPLSPTLATTYTIPSKSIYEVEISGTLAFVAEARNYGDLSGSGGLRILDISNPLNIQQVGLYGDADTIYAIGVYDKRVYIEACKAIDETSCTPGFGQVDVSNPSTPTELTFVSSGNFANDLEIYGNYMYRNNPNNGQIEAGDLTQPNPPTILTPSMGELDIGDGNLYGLTYYGSTSVYSLADPLNPAMLGTYADNRYYGPFDVTTDSSHAYLAFGGKGVQILDTDNLPLSVVGEYDTFGSPMDAEKVGSYVYLLDQIQDLHVLDVSDPLNPNAVGHQEHQLIARKFVQNGNSMIMLGARRFQILDTTNPLIPVPQGIYSTTNFAVTSDMIIRGNYVFLGINAYDEDSLEVVNIANMNNPVMETSIGTYCHGAEDLQMVGDYLYVAENRQCSPGDSHLAIVDISNPASASITATYTITGSYSLGKIALVGHYLYVAHNGYGIRILDVSNPLMPTEAGLYTIADATGYGYTVEEVDGQLYVSAILNDDSVVKQILDISNPTAPVKIGDYVYFDGTLVGDYIYHAAGGLGLMIFTNPNPPTNIYLPMILRE